MDYKMAPGSRFSREWRRNKKYSDKELRGLCRRRGCELQERRGVLLVMKGGKLIAQFNPLPEPDKGVLEVNEAAIPETLRAFAALRLRG